MTTVDSGLEIIAFDSLDRIVKRLPLLEDDVIHVGSGPNAQLPIPDKAVAATVMRIIRTPEEITVNNLEATGAIRLGADQLTTDQPYIWKPETSLHIGDYRLELRAVEASQAAGIGTIAPIEMPEALIASPVSTGRAPLPPLPMQTRRSSAPSAAPPPQVIHQNVSVDSAAALPPRPDTLPGQINREAGTVPMPQGRGWMALDGQPTQVYKGVPLNEPPMSADASQYTRVKDFRSDVPTLSGQITLKQINFVPGERILVPFSLHNTGSHRLELTLALAGFPPNWIIIDPPNPRLEPGQTEAYHLLLQTALVDKHVELDGMLRAYDKFTPQIAVNLPLRMMLKREADLTGSFSLRTLALHLQNHTLSRMTVHLSVWAESGAVQVELPVNRVELGPGQPVRLPVKVRATQRPLLGVTHVPVHLVAQQGMRAPLAIPARVPVQPLVRSWMLLLAGLGGAGLLLSGLLWGLGGVNLGAFLQPPTPTATATATPSPTATATPTTTPSATLTPLPFVDPRSTACQAQVSIPAGWIPYRVRQGENLFRLGIRFGVPSSEIRRVNCLPALIAYSVILVPGREQ